MRHSFFPPKIKYSFCAWTMGSAMRLHLRLLLMIGFRLRNKRVRSLRNEKVNLSRGMWPFFLPNDIVSTPSVRADSVSQRDTASVVTACETVENPKQTQFI